MRLIMIVHYILLWVTMGNVQLLEIDYSNDVYAPREELNGYSLHDLFGENEIMTLQSGQLVTNGDFSNGTNNWATLNVSSFTVDNGIASFTVNSSTGSIASFNSNINNWFNGKYTYFNVKIRTTDDEDVNFLQISHSAEASIHSQVADPVQNQWYILSNVVNNATNGNFRVYIRGNSQVTAQVEYAYAFDIAQLKTDKQYSALFNTTFDLMTDDEIKTQMDDWSTVDFNIPLVSYDWTLQYDVEMIDLYNELKDLDPHEKYSYEQNEMTINDLILIIGFSVMWYVVFRILKEVLPNV